MKLIVSLFFISCCIQFAWADEFKIDVSKELIEAYSQPITELETSVLQNDNRQSAAEIKQEKTDFAPRLSDSESIEKQRANQSQLTKSTDSPVLLQIPKQKQSMLNQQRMHREVRSTQSEQWATDPNLGFHSNQISKQNPSYNDFLGKIHDELRFMVGEEVYGKMAWTYLDLKRLDHWIYETTSQLEIFNQQMLPGSQGLADLSNQLRADLFFWGLMGSDTSRMPSLQYGDQITPLQTQADSTLAVQANQMTAIDAAVEGRFFGVFKYLTILNFWYLTLTIIALVYMAKLFRFLVNQQ